MVESHVNESTMHTLHINMHTHKKLALDKYIGKSISHESVQLPYRVNMALTKDDVTSRRVVAINGEQSSRLVVNYECKQSRGQTSVL